MGFFKKNNKHKTRADPVTMWLNGAESKEILCPIGYSPLSKNEEIRRCVHKIADLVSDMTIMLMENGENGDVRLRNELSKKIDIYPNKNMTRKTFVHKIVTDMLIDGNSVVYPQVKNGLIDDLQILQSNSLHFDAVNDSYQIRYKNMFLNPDEVIHFVLNPDDEYPFKGQGYTKMLAQTVQNLLQANATKKGFLQSKWKPSLIISIQADSEELQDKELRNRILGSYTDTTNEGEPWLIPAGEIDVKTVQPLTLNDLAIQDSITLDIKTIATCFGIPPFMMGVGVFNKDEYNNFISTTIMSIAMIIQQELSKKLLYSPDMYFKFNPKSLMQYNLTEQVQFVKELVGGGMLNRNEGRTEFDYSPVDNEGMNEYNVLENYIPVSQVGDQKKLVQGNADTNSNNDSTSTGATSGGVPNDTSVAQVSLNGAQIQSLLEIVKAVVANQLDYDGAIALITSAFPFNKDVAIEIIGDPSKLSVDEGDD